MYGCAENTTQTKMGRCFFIGFESLMIYLTIKVGENAETKLQMSQRLVAQKILLKPKFEDGLGWVSPPDAISNHKSRKKCIFGLGPLGPPSGEQLTSGFS